MVHTKIPTLKAITVSVCVSILLSMSAYAEAAGAHNNPNQSGREREKTETAECAESHSALTLSDGDTILCGTYTAEGENESVLEASSSVEASVTGAVLQKLSGSASSADASSFRGINAAVRAYENSTIYMDNCTVNVTGGGSGGVQVAGGGTLIGKDLDVTSASKAAIRSDRGGGTMILDGGTYTSTGSNGCPAIYSTADITVRNADCVSLNSRAVIIEGKNSVTLENCTLTGNDQSTKEGSVKANVLLYQSASGDAWVRACLL